jgi:hypothetical protein
MLARCLILLGMCCKYRKGLQSNMNIGNKKVMNTSFHACSENLDANVDISRTWAPEKISKHQPKGI